jgi:hypothetical protein
MMLDKQADPARSKDRIHPQAVARSVGDLAKHDAVFVMVGQLDTTRADRSGSSARSITLRLAPRSVRPTAFRLMPATSLAE